MQQQTNPAAQPASASAARNRAVERKAVDLVRLALEMTAEAGSGHPTSAASLAHIVTALMYAHMRWDPSVPDHPDADRLVLSEGHACPIVYAAGADLGIAIGTGERRPMTREDAMHLRAIDSPIDGHPNPMVGFPFFPAATGSLGQGLSISVGLALAARLDGIGKRIFCLIGDGESREGQNWEALDMLVDQRLTSVCPIFNANGFGQTGPVSSQQSAAVLADKLIAFGVEPVVFDGHDVEAVFVALRRHEEASEHDGRPVALVARTTKGWGTPSLARKPSGDHGKPALGAELDEALKELDEVRARIGGSDDDEHALAIRPIPTYERPARAEARKKDVPTLSEMLAELQEPRVSREGGKLATRKAYGLALRAVGRVHPEVVVLDGDVSSSTYSKTFADDPVDAKRFFECRIAEQNMASVAAGLASGGKTPFASTFGKFWDRAFDQLEMAFVGGFALRIVGSHVGVTPAADGPSQLALSDAAWFAAWTRVMRDGRPLLHVLTPSDAVSTYALTVEMATHDGAVYLRTLRPEVPVLYDEGEEFPIGGHKVLREGEDVLIVAWGYMVHEALHAAERLLDDGLAATVVDLYSLPVEVEPLAELARKNRGRVLCVEDNYGGGLGACVTEALAGEVHDLRVRRMTVERIPKSGRTPGAVLLDLGLSSEDVRAAARTLVG